MGRPMKIERPHGYRTDNAVVSANTLLTWNELAVWSVSPGSTGNRHDHLANLEPVPRPVPVDVSCDPPLRWYLRGVHGRSSD